MEAVNNNKNFIIDGKGQAQEHLTVFLRKSRRVSVNIYILRL